MILERLNKKNLYSPLFWSFLFNLAIILNLINFYALDTIYALLFLVGAITAFQERRDLLSRFYLKPSLLNAAILVFFASGILGYITASPMMHTQWNEIKELRWILGFYACYFLGRCLKKNDSTPILNDYGILAVLFYLFYYHWTQFGKMPTTMDARLQGFYQNTNHLALTLVLLWAYFTGKISLSKKVNKHHLLDIATLLTIGIALLATFSRSSWAGASVAFLAAVFYGRTKAAKISGIFISIVLLGLIAFNGFGIKDRLIYSFDLSANSAQETRTTVWQVNWHIFLDHPLFGVGFSENARLYPEYYQKLNLNAELIPGNAHNQYIEILSGAGIVGLCAYLTIFALAYGYFHRTYTRSKCPERKQVALSALLVIVALLISSLTDTPVRLHETRNYVMILLGVAFGYLSFNPAPESDRPAKA